MHYQLAMHTNHMTQSPNKIRISTYDPSYMLSYDMIPPCLNLLIDALRFGDWTIAIIVIITTIVKMVTIFYNYHNKEVEPVITYKPFWQTLRESQESTYTLIMRHHLSSATIDKLRKDKPLNTTTINDLCRILNCSISSIMEYVPSEEDQTL